MQRMPFRIALIYGGLLKAVKTKIRIIAAALHSSPEDSCIASTILENPGQRPAALYSQAVVSLPRYDLICCLCSCEVGDSTKLRQPDSIYPWNFL
jgi:hypothetical protein